MAAIVHVALLNQKTQNVCVKTLGNKKLPAIATAASTTKKKKNKFDKFYEF